MSNGRGRLHEQMILAACRAYHDQGRANIIKVPEPFRVLKKNRAQGIATVRFTARAEDVRKYRVKFDGAIWFLDYMAKPYENGPF